MSASVLAVLPARTTTEAVQAPVKHDMKVKALTGQYLYDTLVAKDKSVTFMEQVKLWSTQVDTASFASALKDFVAIGKDKGEVAHKTAQVHASNLKSIYGALRFASAEFEKHCGGKQGYIASKEAARRALKDKGIKWDGTRALTKDVQQTKAANAQVSGAQAAVQADNPMLQGEDYATWQARIQPLILAKIDDMKRDEQAEAAEKLVNGLYERHPDLVRLVAAAIMEREKQADDVAE